jgi:NifU-like protein involved in Fe-S cluster formation
MKKRERKGFKGKIEISQAKIDKKIIEEFEINNPIIKLSRNPKNWGIPSISEISVSHSFTGPCGDTMKFFLVIKEGIIVKATFISDGCGTSKAVASQTTLLIEGKSLEFAESLEPNKIEEALGDLPDDHKHCTELAIKTLRNAIRKYKILNND